MASAESPGFFGHVKVLVCLSDYRLNAQVRAPHLIVSSGPKDLAHLLCDSRSVAALVTEIWDDISHAEVKERILDIGRCISELGVTEHTSAHLICNDDGTSDCLFKGAGVRDRCLHGLPIDGAAGRSIVFESLGCILGHQVLDEVAHEVERTDVK